VKVPCAISRLKNNCDSYINVIVVIHNVNSITMELLATMKKTKMKTKFHEKTISSKSQLSIKLLDFNMIDF
jgi:hypothetical protein